MHYHSAVFQNSGGAARSGRKRVENRQIEKAIFPADEFSDEDLLKHEASWRTLALGIQPVEFVANELDLRFGRRSGLEELFEDDLE